MTADEVPLPDIRELGETSLFDAPVRSEPKKRNAFLPNPVNEEYTFATFVHGNCN